jgi:membrane protease YdiL (CAAX protease family)
MQILPPALARALVVAMGVLAVALASTGEGGGSEEDRLRLQVRMLVNDGFVIEAFTGARANEDGEEMAERLDLAGRVQNSRTGLVKKVKDLTDEIKGQPREQAWILQTLVAVLEKDSGALPERVPQSAPGWLRARAQALARGEAPEPSGPPLEAQIRLARWSLLGLFGLFTLVFGLVALTLSPRLFSDGRLSERPIEGVSLLDAFAVVALWGAALIFWDMVVVAEAEAGSVAAMYLHYVPLAVGGTLLVGWALKRVGSGWAGVGVFHPVDRRELMSWVGFGYLGLAVALPVVFVAAWLTAILMPGAPEQVEPLLPVVLDTFENGGVLGLLVVVAVIAPLFEELLFRGFLYGAIRSHMGAAAANVAQALTFAVFHFTARKVLVLFALGVVLGLVRERTGHLLPSVLLHAAWNGGTLLTLAFVLGL